MGIINMLDDEKILVSHTEDCISRCIGRNVVVFSDFLSDREQAIVEQTVNSLGFSQGLVFYGGYADCERKIAGFFPDYYDLSDSSIIEEFPICALKIKCSGFRTHTHRDFLGSILGLGIMRCVIGDIIVGEHGYEAIVFVHTRMRDFLLENLKLVGRDGVKVEAAQQSELSFVTRSFETIKATCASMRLDAVISEILNLSRDKSEKLIVGGSVQVNHAEVSEKSFILNVGDCLTVRGFGKYRICEIGDQNRKGRTRFEAQKYL